MRIDATYNVATPMFCGGVDPRNSAELRLPSFKGVLRFWWRALAWPRCGGNLNEIRQQEDKLFGSASGGQSRVLMKWDPHDGKPKAVERGSVLDVFGRSGVKPVGAGARYLGYGVMEAFDSPKKNTKEGQLKRECFQAPFQFTVQIRCPGLGAEEERSLQGALIALGTLGGMGAKSRKGYGSLVLRSLHVDGIEQWKPPSDIEGLKQAISELRGDQAGRTLPEFTAISGRSRFLLLPGCARNPLEMLDLVGRELVQYRSWGFRGKVLGNVDSEKNFKDDQELMKPRSRYRSAHPRRIAFGLPHNYGPGDNQQVGPWNDHRDTRQQILDRRASPLFIHIHECGASPIAVLSFLPARFLPDGRNAISVGGCKVEQEEEDELYGPIRDFLDRLKDRKKRKEPFGEPQEVGS